MEQCVKNVLEIQELTDIISCVLLMHIRNISHNMLMIVGEVVVMCHYQIEQQNH